MKADWAEALKGRDDIDTGDYLNILKDDIHSAVFATVDRDGHPAARVIDIMLTDENTLYFITAKGKEFYRQLTERKYVAISGMTGGGGSLSKRPYPSGAR